VTFETSIVICACAEEAVEMAMIGLHPVPKTPS
jgi:hypothetical protein